MLVWASSTHPTGGKPFHLPPSPTQRHSINIRILLEGESPVKEEGKIEGCLESIHTGRREAPQGAGAERCRMGWNASQDPSWCSLRALLPPQTTVWSSTDC